MLWLHGLGHFHPENEITNRFLEELEIGTTDSWILERVGIRARRTSLPLDYIRETRNRDPRGAGEAATLSNAQTAKAAGSRYAVTGSFSDFYGKFRVNARVVDAESGEILKVVANDDTRFQDRAQLGTIIEQVSDKIAVLESLSGRSGDKFVDK